MLKNKGAVAYTLKFNGKIKTIEAGALLDVRDFDITTGQFAPMERVVFVTERQIMRKHPGIFEVVAHVENVQIDNQYRAKIDALTGENEELKKKVEELDQTAKVNADKISQMAEEINGFGAKETGYKNQIKKLEKELKDQEEEHKAHVKRITGGK